jgi:dihydroorotase
MLSRRGFLTVPLGAPALAQTPIYDLLLKNGRVLDFRNKRNGRFDIALVKEKIVRVAPDLPVAHAKLVLDLGDYYVTPGLIDIHTHFDAGGADLNLQPDHHALPNGVTTAVDAGGSGYRNFEAFKSRTIDHSKTRILAWLNIVGAGMYGPAVENDVGQMDAVACAAMVKKYPDLIVGVKTAHFQPPTWDAVDRAVEAGRLSSKPVMADFAQKPQRPYSDLLLKHLRPGDIHTHFYGGANPLLDENKKIASYALAARRRGVLFDVGHGAGSFLFRNAVPAIQQGFLPDTISTDIHKRSIMLPRANMTTTMSKLLNLGLSLDQVVERSTVNAASAIHRPELGHLSEGAIADIAVLEVQNGKFGFVDSGLNKLVGDRRIRCVLTIRAGKVVWDADGLSLADWQNAGPYTNYK